ncbi:MAG: DUF4446 family protein [Lachnospiraceae bacterium]|nr:DUF4446 family protein [Lachnospiraceae bacterium]
MQVNGFITLENDVFIYVLLGLLAISIIAIIILLVLFYKLNKRINKFMGTKSSRHSIEEILTDYYAYVEAVDNKYEKAVSDIEELFERLKPCIQKVGIVRYNPFENMGGDLSYALALLDANDDGIIINTIFSRDGSHTYCKPVENGKSTYGLSYEDETALKKAMGLVQNKPRGTEALKMAAKAGE